MPAAQKAWAEFSVQAIHVGKISYLPFDELRGTSVIPPRKVADSWYTNYPLSGE
jgi:hypothetical protein